jgi:alkyl hydroperoxide reductase subunit AhpC
MVDIIEIFNSNNADIESKLLQHVHDHALIFEFLDFVFNNPSETNIANLNHLYKTFNAHDLKIIKNVSRNGQNIENYYKERECTVEDISLKNHVSHFLKSISFSQNLFGLLSVSKSQTTKLPSIQDLMSKIEQLEKRIETLEVGMSNKNVFPDGGSC